MGDDGVMALADSLRKNSSLRSLSLNNNQITDKGAGVLSTAFDVNRTVIALSLNLNSVSYKVRAADPCVCARACCAHAGASRRSA